MDKRTIVCLAVLLTTALGARGARPLPATTQSTTESLDALLEPIREKRNVPGIVAAIVEGEDVIAIGAAGVRKLGSPERMTIDDKLHLGSCTKAMTATVLARLVEQKKLAWDSTVEQVFPDLAPRLHAGFRAVTLEQLLAHRAGMVRDTTWPLLGINKSTTEQRINLIKMTMVTPPETTPGTAFAYSNVGYGVAAAMGEKVTGRPFDQLMQEELFDPLGMKTAGFGGPGTPDQVDQPWGHKLFGRLVVPTQGDNPPVVGPAGRVHCSMRDWAKFVSLHLHGARGEPTTLLSTETFTRLQRPLGANEDSYALGWGVAKRPWAGGTVLTHGGSNSMWYCVVWIAPKKNFAVLAATNIGGDDAARGADDACAAMIQRYYKSHPAASLPTTRRGG